MRYYKFLTDDNRGCYSKFDFSEYLPADGRPGKWLPEIDGKLEMCENGYHGCTSKNLIEWLNAQLFEIEYMGKPEEYDNKVNGRQIRFLRKIETWNERNAQLFSVWCTREALERINNPDPRSVDALDVAERYANGEATDRELVTASAAASVAVSAAASATASAAASAAAWSVASTAAGYVAWSTASAAARALARASAWYAACAADRDAVRAAQTKKLIEMLAESHDFS